MLLSSDGSTTVLLEALVRARLTAVTDRQISVSGAAVPYRLSRLLEAEAQSGDSARQFVERRARLVTPVSEVVSTNLVLVPAWYGEDLLPPGGQPLGRHLADRRLAVRREHLSWLTGAWPYGEGGRACVGKEYLIHCRCGGRIYVREQFNPDIVPVLPLAAAGLSHDVAPRERAPR